MGAYIYPLDVLTPDIRLAYILFMMTLDAYLKAHKISQADFAAAIGVKQPTVHRWTRGEKPSLDVAAKIQNETGGEVPVHVWVYSQLTSPPVKSDLLKRVDSLSQVQGSDEKQSVSGAA